MLTLDKTQVKTILTTELAYDSVAADRFLENFPPIHDELIEAVERWLKDRNVINVQLFGLSIHEVMQTQGYHFLLAVREMNRLLDADVSPEKRERMVKNLQQRIPRW